MTDKLLEPAGVDVPTVFTQAQLNWLPWLEPITEAELTDRHWAGLVDPARAKSPYFMLLARDPDILGARTRTDKDIFYNTKDGLPRAERELAAAAASRFNGCIYCASVHARFATQFSKQGETVQKLLDEGVGADLNPRWNAVVAAAVAITSTPTEFGDTEIGALREQGLSDLEISDVIHGASFFNWANRLMLSIGEPSLT
ncbi:alkylhydroperoxidase domain protein [Acetobacteraceae bacterium H6797]|nr:alkylhydroperoxidase domain protein [Acetobacteraceae bacterium H6797]